MFSHDPNLHEYCLIFSRVYLSLLLLIGIIKNKNKNIKHSTLNNDAVYYTIILSLIKSINFYSSWLVKVTICVKFLNNLITTFFDMI